MKMKVPLSPTLLLLMCWLPGLPLRAQQSSTDDLRKEIQALNETVQSMQKDLQEIKALLMGRAPAAPPASVVFDIGKNPIQGDRSAPLTLVEFSDYQ